MPLEPIYPHRKSFITDTAVMVVLDRRGKDCRDRNLLNVGLVTYWLSGSIASGESLPVSLQPAGISVWVSGRYGHIRGLSECIYFAQLIKGYLAHEKTPTPLGPP